MTQAQSSLGRGTRTALLLRQNTCPKYPLPSFPVQRYLVCPNPTQPGTGVHYIYIPSPSPHRLLLPVLLFLSIPTTTTSHRRPHLAGAILYDRSVQGAIFTQVFHFAWKHPPQSPRTSSPSVQAHPRSHQSVIAHLDLDLHRTLYVISPADIHLVRRPLLRRNPLHSSVTIWTLL